MLPAKYVRHSVQIGAWRSLPRWCLCDKIFSISLFYGCVKCWQACKKDVDEVEPNEEVFV